MNYIKLELNSYRTSLRVLKINLYKYFQNHNPNKIYSFL